MGADLVLYWFGVKKDADLEELKKKMLTKVDELKKSDIDEEILNYFSNPPEKFEELQKEFRDTIKETFQSLNNRDVTSLNHKGETLYLSGGMSWGDILGTCEVFEKFVNLPEPIAKLIT